MRVLRDIQERVAVASHMNEQLRHETTKLALKLGLPPSIRVDEGRECDQVLIRQLSC